MERGCRQKAVDSNGSEGVLCMAHRAFYTISVGFHEGKLIEFYAKQSFAGFFSSSFQYRYLSERIKKRIDSLNMERAE
jgi:hypothetical protein